MKRFFREVIYHCPNKDKTTEKHHPFRWNHEIIYPAWSNRFGWNFFVDFLGFCRVCRTGSISKCLNLRRKLSQNTKKTNHHFRLRLGKLRNWEPFLRRWKDRAPMGAMSLSRWNFSTEMEQLKPLKSWWGQVFRHDGFGMPKFSPNHAEGS